MLHIVFNPSNEGPIVDVSKYGLRVQEFRLYVALIESGWSLRVNSQQLKVLETIRIYFPIQTKNYAAEYTYYIKIEVDHALPLTKFGHVERRLIFPEWIFNLNSKSNIKTIKCSFEGFPSVARVADSWVFLKKILGQPYKIYDLLLSMLCKFKYLPLRTIFLNLLFKRAFHNKSFCFRWSEKGRNFLYKIYDIEYWKVLKKSEMVYCPAGDFVWTYRFYEAVISKALPIIKHEDEDIKLSGYFYHSEILNDNEYVKYLTNIEKNWSIAFEQLTARNDLRPEFFVS